MAGSLCFFSGAFAQSTLSAAWQPVGPLRVASQRYGTVTGRVSAIAVDSADSTGNTVYLGTAGGGVWKSTNAAGPAANVTFISLTDNLPVFNGNTGSAAMPALSIGALSMNNGVLLAGTGDPNDALDSYYGAGILRSADGGLTWTLATGSNDGVAGRHVFTGLAFTGFAWSTTSPGLVVAALTQSAEGVLVNAADATSSVMGLYYSTDSGASWRMATLQDGAQAVQQPTIGGAPGNAATAVVWNPVRQRFYAAVQFHGYYESADGVTWSRLSTQPGTGLTSTACPANPGLGGSASCPVFRGALTVDTTTGDMYALTVDANNNDQGLWRDACGQTSGVCANAVSFATRLDSSILEGGPGNTVIAQADYNLSLETAADGPDTLLLVGTTDLYRCSISAGCVLRNTTNAANSCVTPAHVAPAQHALAAITGAGTSGAPLVYAGNDGGLWRSTDGINQQQPPCSTDDASHFDNLNGGLGSLAEVVSFAQHPTDRETLLAGLGSNGTAATSSAGTGIAWAQLSPGEGGTVAIDPANPADWYVSTAAGVSVQFCGKGSACSAADFAGAATISYSQVSLDASAIHAPFLLDPAQSSNIIVGTCRVWRGPAQTGAGWPGQYSISAMFGGPQNAACSAATNPVVRSLAAGGPASNSASAQHAGSTELLAGIAGSLDGGGNYGGHLFATSSGDAATSSTAWTDISQSPVSNGVNASFNPGGFDVASTVIDAHDATGQTIYAAIAGFAGNGINAGHVFRSSDAGGHWTNISSNLPNVPANALMVDPNDANTVYIGTDAGVYVTSQVTSCSTANCWTSFGTGLPNSPVVALAVSATMGTGTGSVGELRVGTYGRGIWEIPLLTASAQTLPTIALSSTALSFGPQQTGATSAAQTITVTTSGATALSISQVAVSGDFVETDQCTATTLASGATCDVQVSFLPASTGARVGTLTIYANVSGGQAMVALDGTGISGSGVVLTPTTVTFSTTNIGAISPVRNITVSNTGTGSVTLRNPAISGDFSISANSCGASLASGVGCTVSVVFQPTASGTRGGTLSVSGSFGTQTAALHGTGVAPATDALGPLSLSFGPQILNTASVTQAVMLTNSGDAALQLIAAQITVGDFTVVNGCGNSLNGHASCSMLVAFVPRSVGGLTGVLTVTDQYGTQTVALNGTGVAPAGVSLSPIGGLSFPATGVGLSSPAQTVTLANNGSGPLTIQSVAVGGDFAIVPVSNTCGATLSIGDACTMQVIFAPTVAGARTGSLTVADSAPGSPQTLTLSGTGVDFTLSPNGPVSQTIVAGGSAVYALLLRGQVGLPGTAAMACTGAPANSTCVVAPAAPPLAGTTLIIVTIATTSAALEMPLRPGQQSRGIWLAALLPVGLIFLRRARLGSATTALMVLVALALGGCAASRLIPASALGSGASSSGPTPKGTYNITVSGTSAGLTRNVGLTLVVQ